MIDPKSLSSSFSYVPRGSSVSLPHGGLPEIISSYMLKLIKKNGGISGPLGKQFIAQPQLESKYYQQGVKDPLIEDQFEVAPGLIYKYRGKISKTGQVSYYGRALWTITRLCATYCRFCTRGREVGLQKSKINPSVAGEKIKIKTALGQKPMLNNQQINQVFSYLQKHKEINDIILSGGDPLVTPQPYLTKIIEGLRQLQKRYLSIIRIDTRAPITNPLIIQPWHYQLIAKIRNPYLMVHINHPAELTKQSLHVLDNFRHRCLATVMTQSVLLKGVNDSVQVLHELFVRLAEEGIRPYYLYQNDPVYWAKHFTVPIKRAVRIWQQLRPKLSGIAATCRFVIDTPFGFGKIPLPEGNAWKVDYSHFYDFRKKKHLLKYTT